MTVPSPGLAPSWSRHFQSIPRMTRAPGTICFRTWVRTILRCRRRLASASLAALPIENRFDDQNSIQEDYGQSIWGSCVASPHFYGIIFALPWHSPAMKHKKTVAIFSDERHQSRGGKIDIDSSHFTRFTRDRSPFISQCKQKMCTSILN